MYRRAKERANRENLGFSISSDDIIIPEKCPIFNILLFFTVGKRTENTPSLDRIDNNKGYIKGNIRVISQKANRMKQDMTREILLTSLEYIDRENIMYFGMKIN